MLPDSPSAPSTPGTGIDTGTPSEAIAPLMRGITVRNPMSAQGKAAPSPSVWTRPRGGREQPVLSREQIVSGALRLLDADGIDALSMRKLGNSLGAGATSLYRHVANKDELIELAVDKIYGEVELPSPSGGSGVPGGSGGSSDSDDTDDGANWRTETARCAHSLRRTILRHTWIASLRHIWNASLHHTWIASASASPSAFGETGLSHLGPNAMRLSEAMLMTFVRAGFPPHEAGQAGSTVVSYVTGMATTEAAWLTALARTGQTEQEEQEEQEGLERLSLAAEQAARDHPHLREDHAEQRTAQRAPQRTAQRTAQRTEQRGKDPAQAREEDFEYGLARVLDGLESRLTR